VSALFCGIADRGLVGVDNILIGSQLRNAVLGFFERAAGRVLAHVLSPEEAHRRPIPKAAS